jgi:hypothetical protein
VGADAGADVGAVDEAGGIIELGVAMICSPERRTERSFYSSCCGRLPDQLHDDLAHPGPRVELDQRDLLPRAEGQRAVDERDRQRRSDEGGAHVARSVVVAPALVVAVLVAARREALEDVVEVGDRARLEFDRGQGSRRSDDEDCRDPVGQEGLSNRASHLGGDVIGVSLAFGGDGATVGVDHAVLEYPFPATEPAGPATMPA